MTTAVIVPVADKFTAVINGAVFNTSKWIDYLPHHFKLQDLKKLNSLGVTLFVHTDAAGAVTEAYDADGLTKGKSYKTVERAKLDFTDVELQLIAEAVAVATKPAAALTAEAPAQPATITDPQEPAAEPAAEAPAAAPAKKSRKAK